VAAGNKTNHGRHFSALPVADDPALVALLKPYHDGAVAYINTPIGTATESFPGGFTARTQDGPMADLINRVQMDAAAEAGFPVEASLAALFTNDAKLNAGPIKLKDAYAVYIYDNTLYVIEATGQMIKDELEWTATYFNQYYYEPAGVTVNSSVRDYNYDLWSGIEYKLDVTKPVGQRVVELKLNGQPLAMDQVVHVALNNYRATGKFPTAPKLYQSTTEVRELITNWIMERGTISSGDVYEQNYTLLPPVNTWLSTMTAAPVNRVDYADLLWTAFAGIRDDYLKIPNEKKVGATLNREGAFFLLSNKAMESLRDVEADITVLKPYTDSKNLSSWAKAAMAYAIQTGIFTPSGNTILPKDLVTNAEALAWMREARYPLFTFISTNDFHGQLEIGKTVTVSGVKKPVGGSAFNMAYINSYKANNSFGTVLLDAGDIMQGTPISNLLHGQSVIDVYNKMGYMGAVVVTMSSIKWTFAGARFGDFRFFWQNVLRWHRYGQWMVPTAMLTVKGQQIGLIGVTSKDTPTIVMAGNVAGLEFREAGPVVSQLVAELRAAGADVVVALAHMPGSVSGGVVTGEVIGVAVQGVDLIIAGHTHTNMAAKVNNIPIIEQYSSGTALGVSNLRYDRLLRNINGSTTIVNTTWNEGVTPDPAIANIVTYYQSQIAPIVNQVKAVTTGPITKTANAAGESPMGNLLTDAQRWKAGTQIAFTNPGGIRADITYLTYPHNVTFGDLLTVQPFDNKLVTVTMTGEQIYNLLEQQFVVNRILPVSGLHYAYNLALPAGSRITSLILDDGTPILRDATLYSIACNEFIATGGDGFTVFLGATNYTPIGVSDLDALVDYVHSNMVFHQQHTDRSMCICDRRHHYAITCKSNMGQI
jgi:2',3'-cyclic-nucleotide 2'-phosphodiesterase/3'-nucleotidase